MEEHLRASACVLPSFLCVSVPLWFHSSSLRTSNEKRARLSGPFRSVSGEPLVASRARFPFALIIP